MAKLFFNYSSMNAGKSTVLLQTAHNYSEQGFSTLLLTYHSDKRDGQDGIITPKNEDLIYGVKTTYISSRIGLSKQAHSFDNTTDILSVYNEFKAKNKNIGAILVDEAQFLTEKQVKDLSDIVDFEDTPVLCYGIRINFLGQPFVGSMWLMTWADEINEIKTVDDTGKKATFVYRFDENGNVENIRNHKDIVKIGGNSIYKSVSRKKWKQMVKEY